MNAVFYFFYRLMNRRFSVLLLMAICLLGGLGAAQAQTLPNLLIKATSAASTDNSQARSTTVDASGNIYVTGQFTGSVAFGTTTLVSAGDVDIFLAKYDKAGALLWAKRAGGTSNDYGFGVAISGSDVYITGAFGTTANFNTPSETGSNEITSAGGDTDIFLAKYDNTGAFQWAKRAGGANRDIGSGIAMSGSDVYITGSFNNTANFNTPSETGSNEIFGAGGTEIFLAKYDNTGAFQWAKRAGGGSNDVGYGVAVSGSDVYITGSFQSTANFNTPSATGNNVINTAGLNDVFLAKYDNTGAFQWAKRAGAGVPSNDFGYGLAVSGSDVYITGTFQGTANFNTPSATGSNQITSAGGQDIFLAKYNNTGDFQWARRAGGTSGDISNGVFVSGSEVYITGSFNNTANFNTPSATGSNEITSADSRDTFLAKYDNTGAFQWAQRAGGTGADVGNSVAVSGSAIYITGYFSSTADFNTPSATGSNELTTVATNGDAFIVRFCTTVTPSVAIASNDADNSITAGTSVTFTATPTNGGTNPTYVWKKNDTVIPNEIGATYTTNTLVNGDKIKVEMTSSDACASPATATSSEITMAVVNPCLNITNRIYVTPNGTGNGSSWANATSDLQAAINNTCGVTEIWVAAGTYIPQKDPSGNENPANPRDKTFMLKDGVAIYGGFAGNETERSQRNPATNVTILSGDIGTPNDPSDNCYHVAVSVFDGAATVLDGFTITKGTTATSYNFVFVEQGRVARNAGAGLHIIESAITLNNCVFEGNAGAEGSALWVYMYEASPVISRCRFTNNTGIGSSPVGSGMYLYADGNAEISITNCDFSSNTGANQGGAVYLYLDAGTDKLNFIGCTFSGNTAADGGAVYSFTSGTNQVAFSGCTFSGNSADNGGVFYQSDGANGDQFSFTNCLFVGNQSTDKGGALYLNADASTLSNCTIYGNSTTSTTENSGAIYAPEGLTIVNSILWGNTSAAAGAQQQIDYGRSTPNVTYSIVQGTPLISGTGNSNANPLFVNAADPNGADNIFATADDGLTLGSCSPGLNTGNNAVVTSTLDLTQATRIQNTTVDMGAYESANLPVFVTPSVSIVSNDTDNNIASGTSVTFTATPTNGGTSPTYQWKKNNVNVGSNSATYTDNTLANGDKIKVEMTSSATCASPATVTSNELTMAVCSSPTAFSVTGGGDACPGGTGVGIGLNGSQTGVNYQLRRGNTNVGNSVPGTGNALNFGNFSAQGTYTVVATTASGPCSATMNGSATVGTSSPASAGISANQSICSGATPANISLTGLVGSVVRWQRATNANFTGATDINTASSTLTGSSIGSLSTDTWFRAVIQNGTCPAINTSAVRITVQQSFTATAEANNSLICSNQTLRLTALPNQAGLSYNWRGPANFTNTLQNPTRTGLTTAMSGVYSVTITRPSCNNTSSATVSVMVSPSGAAFAPQMSQLRFNNTVPNAQTNTVGVCAGAAVTLQITANAHALTYNWRGPAGGSGSGFMSAPVSGVTNASASITAAVASNQQGQYTVTVRNGCNVINHKVINLQVLNCTSTRLASAEGDGSMGLSLEVAPNPVRDMVNVSVQGITGEVLQLNLVDAQGRSLQRVAIEAAEGKAQHRFDVRSLPAGVYLLQAETATQRATKKVIKL